MKRGMIYLLFALPIASVIMGGVTFYLAFSEADTLVIDTGQTLSKTSWRDDAHQTDDPEAGGPQ
ncbi:MAG: FixH family protein [Gammaproteobacteria bacterium]|nr:FixH family protein [Gammaproteobacteria bacterium]